MKLEQLALSPDRAGRYWCQFSDGSRLGLYRQTVEDFGLYTGLELSRERYEALTAAAGEMSARMRAVRIVSASSVSRKDLEGRLLHKGEQPEDARKAVAWMESFGLVDDRATAETVVRTCAAKGYGLARAKQALYEKRIPREYWEAALADYPDQMDNILSFLRARLADDADSKQVKRAVDALLRRGHSYSVIRRALEQLTLEPEEGWEP